VRKSGLNFAVRARSAKVPVSHDAGPTSAFGEAVSAARVLFLSIIVVGIVGLRLVEG
jgi:hypothetical protein